MEKKYCTAVVLAGGSGKRMGTKVHKQYLMLSFLSVAQGKKNTVKKKS